MFYIFAHLHFFYFCSDSQKDFLLRTITIQPGSNKVLNAVIIKLHNALGSQDLQ